MPLFWSTVTLRLLSHVREAVPIPIPRWLQSGQHEIHLAVSHGTNDNAATARIAYAGISLLCMLIVASFFGNYFPFTTQRRHHLTKSGSRLHHILSSRFWKKLTLIRLLPYLLYLFGIGFDISAAITVAGMGLRQESISTCRGAMYVCLVFYCAVKLCVQVFLIERTHAVRKSSGKNRLDDPLWVFFALVVMIGFGTIAVLAFVAPVGIVDEGDGQCRIGLPQTSVMALMTYDIVINLALTAVFVILLRPLFDTRTKVLDHGTGLSAPISQSSLRSIFTSKSSGSTGKHPSMALSNVPRTNPGSPGSTDSPVSPTSPNWVVDRQKDRLKALLHKSLFGTLVMLTATIINLAVLYRYDGQEHGWICFLCCLIDVTWTVSVIHLLTESPDDNTKPAAVQQQQIETGRRNTFAAQRVDRDGQESL